MVVLERWAVWATSIVSLHSVADEKEISRPPPFTPTVDGGLEGVEGDRGLVGFL